MFRERVERVHNHSRASLKKQLDGFKLWFNQDDSNASSTFYVDSDYESLSLNNSKASHRGYKYIYENHIRVRHSSRRCSCHESAIIFRRRADLLHTPLLPHIYLPLHCYVLLKKEREPETILYLLMFVLAPMRSSYVCINARRESSVLLHVEDTNVVEAHPRYTHARTHARSHKLY
uniref:Uncharacterized protein n=1 Tax=Trichogramma kaykai TaxID=54128 RepID=A0ABD2WMB3_9HYME